MFKSSENLRLAAEMRALERVARPWRAARRTWFDGTPESIEGRLASTERVLTFARAGTTTAHMALEREAARARAELREAGHRLMVDFLDDGARAFKGSKRVVGDDDDDPYYEGEGGSPEDVARWRDLGGFGDDDYDDDNPEDVAKWRDLGRGFKGSKRVASDDDDYDEDVCGDPFDESCRASLDDGEGFDGYCGNCADRLEAQGHWGHHDASRRTAGGQITDHEFKPYSDGPEYCVEELPSSGDTCNEHFTEHARVDPEDLRFLDGGNYL